MSRDHILHKVHTAIGRTAGQAAAEAPPALLKVPEVSVETKIGMFRAALEKLSGTAYLATSKDDARDHAAKLLSGKTAVASSAAILSECGIMDLPGVQPGSTERDLLTEACASAGVGITSADYALADTGSLVMLSSRTEARLISLLPPVHLAVVPTNRLLSGLDELFTLVPNPAEISSSMVLITGPSRTADIEQILVRGVHGPGEVHVILL